jgi:hypothetical protein
VGGGQKVKFKKRSGDSEAKNWLGFWKRDKFSELSGLNKENFAMYLALNFSV